MNDQRSGDINRREVLTGLGAAAAIAVLAPTGTRAASSSAIVETSAGKLRGAVNEGVFQL